MPNFDFKAVTRTGEIRTGFHEAAAATDVILWLQSQNLVPISATPAGTGKGLEFSWRRRRDRLSVTVLATLTYRLGSLIVAGLPIDGALEQLKKTSQGHEELLDAVRVKVSEGEPLSDAFGATGAFPGFYLSVVAAAEASGQLGPGLASLAEYLERSANLRQQLKGALAYPAILAVGALASLAVIFLFVVPRLRELFENFGTEPPANAAIVLAISDFAVHWWWAPLLLAGVAAVFVQHKLKEPAFRISLHAKLFELPLIGTTLREIESARVSRTLGVLLASGVPISRAVELSVRSTGNAALQNLMESAAAALRGGSTLSSALENEALVSSLLFQLASVGEQNGQLSEMLISAADYLDRESQQSLKRLVTIIEPTIIVSLGLIIGLLVTSIIGAIVSLNELPF